MVSPTVPSSKVGKIIGFSLAAALLFVLLLLTAAYSRKRDAELRTRDWIERELQARFQSNVDLEDFHVNVFPRMMVSGEGLSIHYRGRPETTPMIRIEKFSFELGFWSIFRVPHRIQRIHVQRMVITIPPRQPQQNLPPPPGIETREIPHVTAAEIECDNADLLIFSNKPVRDPLDWEIHHLVLPEVGMNKPFFFRGTLTNAKPKGEIETRGKFGPWNVDVPGATRVLGSYGFQNADLGPFPGIAGILSSSGGYKGQLDQLEVDGKTDTPDVCSSDLGKPVPLHTDFSATVDGTNGDTLLHPVRAILGQSHIIASGSVENIREKQGHEIKLDVSTPKARIEDILKLAINSDKPFLRGPVDIKAKLLLPPGKQKVIDKMTLDGSFAVTNGHWSSSELLQCPLVTAKLPSSVILSMTFCFPGGNNNFALISTGPRRNGLSELIASFRMSSMRAFGVLTSNLISWPCFSRMFSTLPEAIMCDWPRIARTGCSSVSPLVPSTVAEKSVWRGTGLPTLSSEKSGVSVLPSTSN